MSADRAGHEAQEHPLDVMWRLGLEELVGKAEVPDRVWEDLRNQVGAGPSRPRPSSRVGAPVWRAVSQCIALAAVVLLLLGVRAEVLEQGDPLFWRGRLPTPWAWRVASQPLSLGPGDALSAHAAYISAREQRALASLRSPSRDPLLRNQGPAVPPTSSPQVSQPSKEVSPAPREEALRTLGELARDPLLVRRTR
ncbi:MAG: hypothetical protein ACP5UM_14695 [Anaerolineae bacterium]